MSFLFQTQICFFDVYFITDASWEQYIRSCAENFGENEDWIKEVLNGGDGGKWAQQINRRSTMFAAVYDDKITVGSEVYSVSRVGDSYLGDRLYSSISFAFVGDTLTIFKDGGMTQYELDRSYQVIEDAPTQFLAPTNIYYFSGGDGKGYATFYWHPASGYGWFGAGIEIREAGSEEFNLVKIDYAYEYTFVAQFERSDFLIGINSVRINYIGGPSFNRTTKQVYFIPDSGYTIFNVIVDADGNITIEETNE